MSEHAFIASSVQDLLQQKGALQLGAIVSQLGMHEVTVATALGVLKEAGTVSEHRGRWSVRKAGAR
jgi:DNA-binding IclR family transcriptional regulator